MFNQTNVNIDKWNRINLNLDTFRNSPKNKYSYDAFGNALGNSLVSGQIESDNRNRYIDEQSSLLDAKLSGVVNERIDRGLQLSAFDRSISSKATGAVNLTLNTRLEASMSEALSDISSDVESKVKIPTPSIGSVDSFANSGAGMALATNYVNRSGSLGALANAQRSQFDADRSAFSSQYDQSLKAAVSRGDASYLAGVNARPNVGLDVSSAYNWDAAIAFDQTAWGAGKGRLEYYNSHSFGEMFDDAIYHSIKPLIDDGGAVEWETNYGGMFGPFNFSGNAAMAINSQGQMMFGYGGVGSFDFTESNIGGYFTTGVVHSETGTNENLLEGWARSVSVELSPLALNDKVKIGPMFGAEHGYTTNAASFMDALPCALGGTALNVHEFSGVYVGMGGEFKDIPYLTDVIENLPGMGTYIKPLNVTADYEKSTYLRINNGEPLTVNMGWKGLMLYQGSQWIASLSELAGGK